MTKHDFVPPAEQVAELTAWKASGRMWLEARLAEASEWPLSSRMRKHLERTRAAVGNNDQKSCEDLLWKRSSDPLRQNDAPYHAAEGQLEDAYYAIDQAPDDTAAWRNVCRATIEFALADMTLRAIELCRVDGQGDNYGIHAAWNFVFRVNGGQRAAQALDHLAKGDLESCKAALPQKEGWRSDCLDAWRIRRKAEENPEFYRKKIRILKNIEGWLDQQVEFALKWPLSADMRRHLLAVQKVAKKGPYAARTLGQQITGPGFRASDTARRAIGYKRPGDDRPENIGAGIFYPAIREKAAKWVGSARLGFFKAAKDWLLYDMESRPSGYEHIELGVAAALEALEASGSDADADAAYTAAARAALHEEDRQLAVLLEDESRIEFCRSIDESRRNRQAKEETQRRLQAAREKLGPLCQEAKLARLFRVPNAVAGYLADCVLNQNGRSVLGHVEVVYAYSDERACIEDLDGDEWMAYTHFDVVAFHWAEGSVALPAPMLQSGDHFRRLAIAGKNKNIRLAARQRRSGYPPHKNLVEGRTEDDLVREMEEYLGFPAEDIFRIADKELGANLVGKDGNVIGFDSAFN